MRILKKHSRGKEFWRTVGRPKTLCEDGSDYPMGSDPEMVTEEEVDCVRCLRVMKDRLVKRVAKGGRTFLT